MPWLTRVLGTPVRGPSGGRVGRVRELLATRARFPEVTAVAVRLDRSAVRDLGAGERTVVVTWKSVARPDGTFTIAGTLDAAAPGEAPVHLGADLLDRQIVDTDGARVVRVNDVLLSESAGGPRVVGADVGVRGVLRRLGLERAVVRIAETLGYHIPDRLIGWNYVAPIEEGPRDVRLTIPTSLLRELRPSELADILDRLDTERRERILRVMTTAALAETLAETHPEVGSEALEMLGEERARRILEVMPPDEAADLLGAVGYERAERLLSLMGVEAASVLRDLLGYPPDVAGGRMTPSFVAIPAAATVSEAIEWVRREARTAETVYYVYVLDEDGRLEGVLSLRDLLRNAPEREVRGLMETDVVSVNASEDQEEVARTMARYDLLALPVTDDAGRLRGIVTVDDVVEVLQEEASEDLAEVAGIYLGEGPTARAGRMAGFGVSVLGGSVGAVLLAAQRPVLAAVAAVAWLLPLYLRVAQDLGTWSLARSLAIVTLSTGKRLEALAQELMAALFTAAFSGLLVGGFGAWWSGHPAVGLFLGVGIFVGSLAASLIGLALPNLVRTLGLNWVLARGRPLAVTVGLASLLVYVWALGSLAGRRF